MKIFGDNNYSNLMRKKIQTCKIPEKVGQGMREMWPSLSTVMQLIIKK